MIRPVVVFVLVLFWGAGNAFASGSQEPTPTGSNGSTTVSFQNESTTVSNPFNLKNVLGQTYTMQYSVNVSPISGSATVNFWRDAGGAKTITSTSNGTASGPGTGDAISGTVSQITVNRNAEFRSANLGGSREFRIDYLQPVTTGGPITLQPVDHTTYTTWSASGDSKALGESFARSHFPY